MTSGLETAGSILTNPEPTLGSETLWLASKGRYTSFHLWVAGNFIYYFIYLLFYFIFGTQGWTLNQLAYIML